MGKEFIREIEGRYGEEVEKNIEALRNVVSGEKEDRIVSFSDLDARFGKTSPEDKKGFAGYKVDIVEDESEIITRVDLLKGNQSEGKHLLELLKQERGKGIGGKGVVGDGIYDDGENYREIEEEGMKAYITFNPRHRRQ